MLPYRLKCPFARQEGYCDYWRGIVKCVDCKFANHPEKAHKEIEDLIIYHRRHNKAKTPGV